jgi:two-component system LytT family response regulator
MSTSNASRVTTLIVDDEPVARAGLRHLLGDVEWIECIGEAASGPATVAAIDTLKPELVFLDIQMPGLLGTDVLRRVQHQPFVIFTTAYAEHAVTAFELGALDYLLKPFGEVRLLAALERLRAAIGEPRAAPFDRFSEAMSHAPMNRLFVRTGRSIVPVCVNDIAWFEAVGDYIVAHERATQHLLHVPLGQLETRLDPQKFVRIHRSHVVNLDHVAAFRRNPEGRMIAHMTDGPCLVVSRTKAQELRSLAR